MIYLSTKKNLVKKLKCNLARTNISVLMILPKVASSYDSAEPTSVL